MKQIWEFCCEETAATSVEYAVMLALILVVCIASITLVGGGTFNFWNNNSNQLDNAFGS